MSGSISDSSCSSSSLHDADAIVSSGCDPKTCWPVLKKTMAASNSRSRYDEIRSNNEEDVQEFSYSGANRVWSSQSELSAEMKRIGGTLSTVDTNWKVRVECIRQMGNLLSSDLLNTHLHLAEALMAELYFYRDAICTQIGELRSGVIKEICAVLSYLAICIDESRHHQTLKEAVQPFIDYIVPYLLKQTQQTILIISHCSNVTLRSIIKRIPVGMKCIQHIVANTKHQEQKSICLRVRCMEYIQIMLDTQQYHAHYLGQQLPHSESDSSHAMLSLIMQAIISNISDPHPSVRYIARQCVWSLHATYPQQQYSQYILANLSSQNAKYVISDKVHFQRLPPPIGKGHKVELSMNGKALTRSSSSINKNTQHNNNNKKQHNMKLSMGNENAISRPKSALPSKQHRLQLLKKKKREMAAKLHQNKPANTNSNAAAADIIIFAQPPTNIPRPQTAHPRLQQTQIGQPHRITIAAPTHSDHSKLDDSNHSHEQAQDEEHEDDVVMNGQHEDDHHDNDMHDNHNHHSNEPVISTQRRRTRKISIRGNATRFSPNPSNNDNQNTASQPSAEAAQQISVNKPRLSQAIRIETSSANPSSYHQAMLDDHNNDSGSLQDIVALIQSSKLDGIQQLNKWLEMKNQENEEEEKGESISVILLSLTGFLDCITMNKPSNQSMDLYLKPLVYCMNHLIFYVAGSPNVSVHDLLPLLTKMLRLCIQPNCQQYIEKYAEYSRYFESMAMSLLSTQNERFSLKAMINALSQTVIKPKQKLICLHLIACFCHKLLSMHDHDDHNQQEWNMELVLYLFHCVKDVLTNTHFLEYHPLFQSPTCRIIDDILKYIIFHQTQHFHSIFQSQLNATLIETLLGVITDSAVIQVLQKYYYSLHTLNTLNPPHNIANIPIASSGFHGSTMSVPSTPNNTSSHLTQQSHHYGTSKAFTTPSHQNKKYQRIRKTQIESLATPPLNMYMTTPALIHKKYTAHDHQSHAQLMHVEEDGEEKDGKKENEAADMNMISSQINCSEMSDEQLVDIVLSKHKSYIKTMVDEKSALKHLSHRITANKVVFHEKGKDILLYVMHILNHDEFMLHRNALRILQALCWFYPQCINNNLQVTLQSIVHLFRKSAPTESGELALDVITQFCKIVDYKLCMFYLLPIIEKLIKHNDEHKNDQTVKLENARKIFAALSIFDRLVVLAPKEWIQSGVGEFAQLLIAGYRYYREPMRSLIYLSILLDGETAFLQQYQREQKIVQMMSKEADFTEWVKSHRPRQYKS